MRVLIASVFVMAVLIVGGILFMAAEIYSRQSAGRSLVKGELARSAGFAELTPLALPPAAQISTFAPVEGKLAVQVRDAQGFDHLYLVDPRTGKAMLVLQGVAPERPRYEPEP